MKNMSATDILWCKIILESKYFMNFSMKNSVFALRESNGLNVLFLENMYLFKKSKCERSDFSGYKNITLSYIH